MRAKVATWKLVFLGAAVAAAGSGVAEAKSHGTHAHAFSTVSWNAGSSRASVREGGVKRVRIGGHGRKEAYFARAGDGPSYGYESGIQCVPFARENTGIELAGNAAAWWYAAAGVYERGARPEVGSILNFRATGRMRSGHVAVVSNVENARTVEIDHANWANHGGISRNVTVVDVSPDNDWSAVRVELGRDGEFGSIYPTYGFIYDRPDHGAMLANNATAPMPNALNPAPHDLRPVAVVPVDATNGEPVEVADAFSQPRERNNGIPRYRRYGIDHSRSAHQFRVSSISHSHGRLRRF